MTSGTFRFAGFELDPADRRLSRDGAPVELSARYLDALLLMAREPGRLVTKERFHDEVWRGIPVTDEALTQCIATLRRQLGDEAGRPRFIETVPKHGYRFIAPVEWVGANGRLAAAEAALDPAWREFLTLAGAGTLGGGVAGLIGGLLYGFAAAAQPGVGAISVLLVLAGVCALVGLAAAAGVSLGIAAAGFASAYRALWIVVGGAGGGVLVGAMVKLLGTDAFNLLTGRTPGDIAGAPEGVLLGGVVGLAAWLAAPLPQAGGVRGGPERDARTGPPRAPAASGRGGWSGSLRRGVAIAMALGALGGVLISLLGGRLMLGSLELLARSFPGSQLQLAPIGAWFGEDGLGPVGQAVSSGLEGALFGGCIVGAMILARSSLGPDARGSFAA
jgi:DNA-binding winged helix-turn-helix (wHTH) protein